MTAAFGVLRAYLEARAAFTESEFAFMHLLLIDPASHREIVEHVPGYAAAFRTGLQKHAAAKDNRIVSALSASAEERYEDFLKTYPSIAQRVPQWMLASYLGVSPETVSRIRKNRSRRSS